MFSNVFCRPDLNRLIWNGQQRAAGKQDDFAPVVRLWFPNTPCQWFLTDCDTTDDEWVYGLCISGADDAIELNYWSRSQFERLAAVPGPFGLRSSSRFGFNTPLSNYLRAVTRKKAIGF